MTYASIEDALILYVNPGTPRVCAHAQPFLAYSAITFSLIWII